MKQIEKYGVLILAALLLIVQVMKAEPVDTVAVKSLAQRFFQDLTGGTSRSMTQPSIVYKAESSYRVGDRHERLPYYYIVNMGEEGYVIMAADDRVSPVLAYSTTSSFESGNVPPNMAFLLSEYQQQIEDVYANQDVAVPAVAAEWDAIRHQGETSSRSVVVAPLLTTTWAQNPLYNNCCPVDPRSESGHCVAGCAAVAMGQIMRYWQFPEQGEGSHSYVANNSAMGSNYGDYGTLTADFENAFYDYANMPAVLTSASTSAEVNAVATLLYHCGVSLDMAYGAFSSSSSITIVDDAFRDYFGYGANVRHIYRNAFAESSWLSIMKNELNHLRPVLYSGGNVISHSFVCDGYDSQNFFHMNWGWGGYADGYFILSNLNPDTLLFNTTQTAVINLEVNPPMITVSEEELFFYEEEGMPSAVQRVDVQAMNLQEEILIKAPEYFRLSIDSVNYQTQLVLPLTGGSFFVKFVPEQRNYSKEGLVTLRTGVCRDSVRVTGLCYIPECESPVFITATQDDEDTTMVRLSWQAPPAAVSQMSWDTVPESFFGGHNPYTVMIMHRMDEADLLPYHKHLLTQVSFIANAQVSEYKLVVFKGGGLVNHGSQLVPGTQVVEQTIPLNSLTMGAWNTIDLDTPLEIDARQELWYGIYLSSPAQSYTVPIGGQDYVPFKGSVYGYVSPDGVLWLSHDHNFILKATVENPFVQYEVYRDDTPIAVPVLNTSYIDYPPAYGLYTYEVRAVWNDQCSSGISYEMNFRPPCHVINRSDTIFACEEYVWENEVSYTESGRYLYEYYNEDDCWQVDTLYLTIGHPTYYTDVIRACDSLTWINGVTYTESTQSPVVVLTNSMGCDSVVRLNFIKLKGSSYIDTVVACDSYTWIDGVTYTESVEGPTVNFEDVMGCENATVTLCLTILSSSSSEDTVIACDSYTWRDGVTYTESTEEPTFVCRNAAGCDSVITLHLTVNHSIFQIEEHQSCEPYTWLDGHEYTASTDTPTVTYRSSMGCDSVIQLHLVITNSVSSIDEQSACDAYTWIDGVVYSESTTTPTMVLSGSAGCDSVVTLHLTIRHSTSATDSIYADEPYTWIDGVTYSESVEGPTMILENVEGCDSVVILYLMMGVDIKTQPDIQDMKAYPNPTYGQVHFAVAPDLLSSGLDVQIFDVYGKLLHTDRLGTTGPVVDLSHYAQGIYILRVCQGNTVLGTLKISKLAN